MQPFSSLILKQLTRTLASAGAMIAVAVWAYAFLEVRQSESHAGRLLLSQIQSLSQSQVNAQDVIGIEREVARFIDEWNRSQPIVARVQVMIDGMQVALAGPTQPFRRFYSRLETALTLPSGSALRIEIQMGHGSYWVHTAITIAIVETLILALFFLLNRRVGRLVLDLSRPIEESAQWISRIAMDLPASARTEFVPKKSGILEVESFRDSVKALAREIVDLEGKITRIHLDRGRLEMADQIVHDIRSPLATTDLRISTLRGVSSEEKEQIRAPIRRIQDIINTLLNLRRQARVGPAPSISLQPIGVENSTELLAPLIEQVISEKRIQYASRPSIRIEGPTASDCFDFCAAVSPTEFQRVMSNLIDNAVEAIAQDGWVIVKTAADRSFLQIEVSDTGKGMSQDEVSRVLEQAESIGKPHGSGLGLRHARAKATDWGGTLSLESESRIGTTVRLRVPRTRIPAGLLRKLDLTQIDCLAILDDDPTIHALWRTRLGAIEGAITIRYYQSPEELLRAGQLGNTVLYLVDHDFGPGRTTGLDLIQRTHLRERAILVTSRYADPAIVAGCDQLGIRRIPKDWIGFISIQTKQDFEQANGDAVRQSEQGSALLNSTGPTRAIREVGV